MTSASPSAESPAPASSVPPSASRRPPYLALLILLAAWGFLWAPQLFMGRIFALGDWPANDPFEQFSAERWQQEHQRTLWNPYVFAGLPAAASLADARPQYLPDFALDALTLFDKGPVWPVLVLPLLAHLAGMIAAALLVRALWGCGTAGMVWAGLAWGWMPNLVIPLAYGHHAQLVTASLMPLALLTVHATCRADTVRGAARASLGLALVIAIQTLAGHPQFVYYSALLVAAFAIERVWNARRPWRLAWCASGALLGVAMSAAIAWPMVLYGAASVRGTGAGVLAEEAMRYALAPRDFLTFGWPAAMGFAGGTYWGGMSATDYPVYFGVLVTGLCLALPFSGLARREGPTRLLLGVALLATLLTLGVRLGAVDAFLRAVVPLWSRFRTPVAVVIVAQLAAVLISARALTGLLAAVSAGRSKLLVVLAAAGLLLAAGLATMHEPFESSYAATAMAARAGFQEDAAHAAANAARGDLAAVLVIAALAAALLALRGRLPKATAFAVAGMLLIAAFDLGRVSVLFMHLSSAPRSALAASPLPPIARLAADEPLFRVSTATYDSLVLHNQWIPWRARSIGGGHGVPPLLWAQVASSGLLQRASALRAMSVRYVVVPPGARPDESDFERVTATDSAATIWRVRSALPRAYAVPAVRAPGNDMAVMSAMASLDSFPERVAFASDPAAAGDYPGSRDASIRWLEDAPDRLKLEVDAPERAFVVVADAWFEGWTARLDDRAIPIRRINHLLRGVAVEAGRHILTFDYVPAGWREGVATTRLCGALWLVLLAATLLPVPPRRLQTTQALGPGRE